jgi:hypothetical protein
MRSKTQRVHNWAPENISPAQSRKVPLALVLEFMLCRVVKSMLSGIDLIILGLLLKTLFCFVFACVYESGVGGGLASICPDFVVTRTQARFYSNAPPENRVLWFWGHLIMQFKCTENCLNRRPLSIIKRVNKSPNTKQITALWSSWSGEPNPVYDAMIVENQQGESTAPCRTPS